MFIKLNNIEKIKVNNVLINQDYLEKINKINNKKIANLKKISYILLRYLVLKKLNVDIINIDFKYNQYNKPLLDVVNFNISKSSNSVACFISDNKIGIDLEINKKRKINKNIFDTILSNKKKNYKNFFKEWTKLESYYKRLGTGISTKKLKLEKSGYFKTIRLYKNYIFTISLEKKEKIKYEKISYKKLMKPISNIL